MASFSAFEYILAYWIILPDKNGFTGGVLNQILPSAGMMLFWSVILTFWSFLESQQ